MLKIKKVGFLFLLLRVLNGILIVLTIKNAAIAFSDNGKIAFLLNRDAKLRIPFVKVKKWILIMENVVKFCAKFVLILSIVVPLCFTVTNPAWAGNGSAKYVAGELLVKPKAGISKSKTEKILKAHSAVSVGEIKQIRVRRIKVPSHALEKVKAALAKNPHIEFVENNFIADGALEPNDSLYPSQWHLEKISAPDGWDLCTGSQVVPIAIIDSGVDPAHPDLSAKLLPGYNFLDESSDTHDVLGHGTAVAGSAAAISNNVEGVAGVAWENPIMPLVVVNSDNQATYYDTARAITYTADHGARVVNMSIGGSSSSSTLQNAIDYAWNKGAVIFASAANYSTDTPYYPAACANVMAVSATNADDALASFSNYGNWIDISAPGVSILTTTQGGEYDYKNGTSFSSPIAAGLAALILSINPSFTNTKVLDIIIQNVDDLGEPGFDQYYGYGRVNVHASLIAAAQEEDNQPPVLDPIADVTVDEGQTVSFSPTATDPDGDTLTFTYSGWMGQAGYTTDYNDAGTHTVTVTVSDSVLTDVQDVMVTVNDVNRSPEIIAGPTAVPAAINEDETSTITVEAADPDLDSLTYAWLAAGGSITGSGPTITYNPPDVSSSTICTITVTVDDGRGETVSGSVDVTVNPVVTDTTPPANISDLSSSNITQTSVDLSWTSPGDDGDIGTASQYDIKYRENEAITDINWNDAATIQCIGEPTPQIAGSSEIFTITGLSPSTTYYFALKTADEVPNWSDVSNYASEITKDLVGEWHFEQEEGIIASDSSGNNNNGTLLPEGSEPIWGVGKIGEGLEFDGSINYVEIQDSDTLDGFDQITLIAWVKPNLGTVRGSIIARYLYDYGSSINERVYELDIDNDDTINFALSSDGTGSIWLNSAGTVIDNDNIWTHISATSDGTTMKIYINGEQDPNTELAPTTIHSSAYNLQIGTWEYSPNQRDTYFNGLIDEVRIYSRALNPAEILADYERGITIGSISGTITDEITALAIEGAIVTDNIRQASTDTNGNYTLTNIPVGSYSVTASKADYQEQSQDNVEVFETEITIVNFQLMPTGTCSGYVTLQNRADHSSIISVELRNPGEITPIKTYEIVSAEDGAYILPDLPPGIYDIAVKTIGALRAKTENVVIEPAETVFNINFELLFGDADGNNVVNIFDHSILNTAFDSSPGDGNWDERVDFDGNNVVNIFDHSILNGNFGKVGEE